MTVAFKAAAAVDAGAIAKHSASLRASRMKFIRRAWRPCARRCMKPKIELLLGVYMIDLYTWTTPNGRKASIMLEECGLPYKTHAINIGKDDQFTPQFVALNPNSKIPAMVDSEGPDGNPLNIFESGAILIYLAEKTGKFLASSGRARSEALQWLMFQMGGVGRYSGRYITSCAPPRSRCRMPSSVMARKKTGFTGAGQAPETASIFSWRLLDSRHRDLPVGGAL
jgi:hypothetical protein